MVFRVQPPEKDLTLWMQKNFILFETYLRSLPTAVLYTAAPINPEEGMIVRADGTSWDPGSGAGFYGYHAGAWVFLG